MTEMNNPNNHLSYGEEDNATEQLLSYAGDDLLDPQDLEEGPRSARFIDRSVGLCIAPSQIYQYLSSSCFFNASVFTYIYMYIYIMTCWCHVIEMVLIIRVEADGTLLELVPHKRFRNGPHDCTVPAF